MSWLQLRLDLDPHKHTATGDGRQGKKEKARERELHRMQKHEKKKLVRPTERPTNKKRNWAKGGGKKMLLFKIELGAGCGALYSDGCILNIGQYPSKRNSLGEKE